MRRTRPVEDMTIAVIYEAKRKTRKRCKKSFNSDLKAIKAFVKFPTHEILASSNMKVRILRFTYPTQATFRKRYITNGVK